MTLISIGASVPEVVTSVYAAYDSASSIVVGDIVGSEMARTTTAMAEVAFISPIVVERRNVQLSESAMRLAMIVMPLTHADATIGRSEGFLLMLSDAQFIHDLYSNECGEESSEEIAEPIRSSRRTVPWIVGGPALVVVGGQVMVTNGVVLARLAGIFESVVGLGTTLPEIALANTAQRSRSVTDMVAVPVIVLALKYRREGIDRRAAVVCVLPALPTFVVL